MKLGRLTIELRKRSAPVAPVTVRYAPRVGVCAASVDDPDTALTLSAVYRCVNVIAGSVAALPFDYLKRNGNGVFSSDTRSNLPYLLKVQPNPDFNAYDFIAYAVRCVLLEGNAYIVPIKSQDVTQDLLELVIVRPSAVTYDKYAGLYTINDLENGISGEYTEREIIHLKGLSLDGRRGLSVLSFARLTMNISATGDAETLNRFANGGNIRGLVSNDTSVKGFGEYADAELSKAADDLDAQFQAGARIVSVPGQAQFSQLSLSSVDMEFLSSRKFNEREIARFFGVPPTYLYDDTSNNYKSAELASVDFLQQTLNPLLTMIEQEFTRKLIPAFRFGKYKFQFDRRAISSMDMESRADYQTKTIAAGIYTINDWKRYENLPTVPDGDRVLVSANLKALEELTNPQTDE